jgi:hypothetical protein
MLQIWDQQYQDVGWTQGVRRGRRKISGCEILDVVVSEKNTWAVNVCSILE